MDSILTLIEEHPTLITICLSLLGGVGFLIKRVFFYQNKSSALHIEAGGDIAAGGDIIVGNKIVQHFLSTKSAETDSLDRLKSSLFDIHNWQPDGISKAYYKLSPEFTLEYGRGDHDVEGLWWSDFLGEVTKKFNVVLRYHITTLKTVLCCRFAGENLTIPYPEVDYVRIDHSNKKEANNTYSLFYFLQDSIEFSLLCYLLGVYKTDITKEENQHRLLKKGAIVSQEKPPIKSLPFMIFNNIEDKNNFITHLEKNIDNFFREKSIRPTMKLGDDKLKEEEAFAYWAYDLYFDKYQKAKE